MRLRGKVNTMMEYICNSLSLNMQGIRWLQLLKSASRASSMDADQSFPFARDHSIYPLDPASLHSVCSQIDQNGIPDFIHF